MTGAQTSARQAPIAARWPLRGGLSGISRILRVAGSSVGLKIGSVVMSFVTMVLIARALSVSGVGVYALAGLSVTLGAIVASAGFDALALRLGARSSKVRTRRRTWAILTAFAIALPVSAAIAVGLVAALLIGYGLRLETMLAPIAIQSCAVGAYRVAAAAAQAHEKIILSQIGQLTVRPAVVLALAYVLQASGALTEERLLWAMAAGAVLSLFYIFAVLLLLDGAARPWRRRLPLKSAVAGLSMRAPPYAGFFAVVVLLEQVDILLLGLLRGAAEAGLYQPASRVAWAAALGAAAVSIFARPQFAKAAADRAPARIRRLMRQCRAVMLAYFTVASCFLIVFSKQIFALFGAAYDGAGVIMAILLAVHGLTSLIGPVDAAAQALGSGRDILMRALLSLCVFVIAGLVLIPVYGAIGAAIAALLGGAIYRLSFLGFVQRKLNELES